MSHRYPYPDRTVRGDERRDALNGVNLDANQIVAVHCLNEAMLVLFERCSHSCHCTEREAAVIKSVRETRAWKTLTDVCVIHRDLVDYGYYKEGILEDLYRVLVAKYLYVTELRRKVAELDGSVSGLFDYVPLIFRCITLCENAIIAMDTKINKSNPG